MKNSWQEKFSHSNNLSIQQMLARGNFSAFSKHEGWWYVNIWWGNLQRHNLAMWLWLHAHYICFACTKCWRLDGSRGKALPRNWKLSRPLVFHWLCVISPSRFLRHINNQKTAEPLVMLTELQFVPAKFQLAQAFWCWMLVLCCRQKAPLLQLLSHGSSYVRDLL